MKRKTILLQKKLQKRLEAIERKIDRTQPDYYDPAKIAEMIDTFHELPDHRDSWEPDELAEFVEEESKPW